MEFKTIYTIKEVKARFSKHCKGCNKEIKKNDIYKLVHQNTGHELPDYNEDGSIEWTWDCHYAAYIGMYHLECLPNYKKIGGPFKVEIINIIK
jgi:hypothetical protein